MHLILSGFSGKLERYQRKVLLTGVILFIHCLGLSSDSATNTGIEKVFVTPTRKIGSFFWKKGDIGIIDKFGPDGISNVIKFLSNKAVKFQTGYVYQYAFVMLIGFSILLTILIIK